MARAIVKLTTGNRGAGKSLRRGPHFLLEEWLTQNDGDIHTNLPIFRDKIAQAVIDRTGKGEVENLIDRIKIIPDAELKRWDSGESGPWQYFADTDLRGAHVQIDEVQNYLPVKAVNQDKVKKWRQWLSEVRHLGFTLEFITQDPMDCHDIIRKAAAVMLYIETDEEDRDAFFGIKMKHWHELVAKFVTGKYRPICREVEKVKREGKWHESQTTYFVRSTRLFDLYDSYSRPHTGGVKAQAPKQEHEKRGRLGLFAWFIGQNFTRISTRLIAALLVVGGLWFLVSGGMGALVARYSGVVKDSVADEGNTNNAHTTAVSTATTGTSARLTYAEYQSKQSGAVTEPVQPEVIQVAEAMLEEAEHKANAAEQVLDEWRTTGSVVLVTRDSVTFRDGFTYEVGEPIDIGPHAGRMIQFINFKKRAVTLDDSTILRMGIGGGTLERRMPGGDTDHQRSELQR